MRDVDKALADILEIRSRIASHTDFRGYGPMTIAVTGAIGLSTAAAQSIWGLASTPFLFVAQWLGTAALCAVVIGLEMAGRSKRLHSSLADAMIYQAIEQFLPATAASVFFPILIVEFSPQNSWMLPGLWQVFVSLGIFASMHNWPRSMMWAGAWYFVSGFVCLLLASQTNTISPWMMGIPFLLGQFLMATILYFSTGGMDGED